MGFSVLKRKPYKFVFKCMVACIGKYWVSPREHNCAKESQAALRAVVGLKMFNIFIKTADWQKSPQRETPLISKTTEHSRRFSTLILKCQSIQNYHFVFLVVTGELKHFTFSYICQEDVAIMRGCCLLGMS